MFLAFFAELRAAKIPVTLREYLTLLEALEEDLAEKRVEDFYYLSRACLVKDERNLDKFDRVFGHLFKGLETLGEALGRFTRSECWRAAAAPTGSTRCGWSRRRPASPRVASPSA